MTKRIHIDLTEAEHRDIRILAASIGIPTRTYAHRALVQKATSDLVAMREREPCYPLPPLANPPAKAQPANWDGENYLDTDVKDKE